LEPEAADYIRAATGMLVAAAVLATSERAAVEAQALA
jgi:hypothetical protein